MIARLVDIFRRFTDQPASEPVIHIHEDDWGMRNLYPLEAQAEVAADVTEAAAASERNRDPSGAGWNDMHAIQPPAHGYDAVGLRVADVAAALEPIMPRVRRFYATVGSAIGSADRDPLGSYEEDAWCFGLGGHCYVKIDTAGDVVSAIWFDLYTSDPADAEALKQALQAVDRLVPSFVADYFTNEIVTAGDADRLDAYLNGFLRAQGAGAHPASL